MMYVWLHIQCIYMEVTENNCPHDQKYGCNAYKNNNLRIQKQLTNK